MEILRSLPTGTGSNIKGDAVMLDRSGTIYNVLDNAFHPNPGTEDDEYSEIERCVDWLFKVKKSAIVPKLKLWIRIKVAQWLEDSPDDSLDEVILNVMYSDLYDPQKATKECVKEAYDYFNENPDKIESYSSQDDVDVARSIASYINETFLRVRAGGKLNPQGANAIYFRISSHGFDWHRVIEDFLWDTFDEPSKMPKVIWIGHDAETNPPEKVLFRGTAQELFDQFDDRKFEKVRYE